MAYDMHLDHGPMSWTPTLEGVPARRAAEAVEAIASALDDPRPSNQEMAGDDASLAGGHAGLAVFHHYLSRWRGDGATDLSMAHLDAAVAFMAERAMPPSLYSGFTGIAWAHAHLARQQLSPLTNGVDALDHEDLYEAVDEALVGYLAPTPLRGDYDLINGLVGLGVYAIERLPDANGDRLLSLVIARLGDCADVDAAGVRWRTSTRSLGIRAQANPLGGEFNLGVAHGTPGAIALLGHACAAGHASAAIPLLEGAVDWLLAQQISNGEGPAFAPFASAGSEQYPARLAWCYGDAGIAAALLAAARGAGRADWEAAARDIARRAAARSFETSGVEDAGLCHGASGLAHIFNRLHQATGDPALGAGARVWFERTLDFARDGDGIGGFVSVVHEESGAVHESADPGLLGGAAGIGLSLVAACSAIAPDWDRMLLVSAPPALVPPSR